jgi:hypothetical protein
MHIDCHSKRFGRPRESTGNRPYCTCVSAFTFREEQRTIAEVTESPGDGSSISDSVSQNASATRLAIT